MYTNVISKPIYQILSDLTQESRIEVALPLAIKDWVRLKRKETGEQRELFEQRYGMDFQAFKQSWREGRIANKHSYDIERDYWEWEATITDEKRLIITNLSQEEKIMTTEYGLQITLNLPYEEAIEKATAALKEEGFGVLTKIDVKATLKKKLNADFRRYVILGTCNPNLAYQALQNELEIGLLLPCNVIVYETGQGQSAVSIVDPMAMLGVVENDSLRKVADEAQTRLTRVVEKLGSISE